MILFKCTIDYQQFYNKNFTSAVHVLYFITYMYNSKKVVQFITLIVTNAHINFNPSTEIKIANSIKLKLKIKTAMVNRRYLTQV